MYTTASILASTPSRWVGGIENSSASAGDAASLYPLDDTEARFTSFTLVTSSLARKWSIWALFGCPELNFVVPAGCNKSSLYLGAPTPQTVQILAEYMARLC